MVDITPIDIIGYVIVLFVTVEIVILTIKLFKDYNKDKAQMQLLFGITFLSLSVAVILLIMEKIFLGVILNDYVGMWFAWLARCCVCSAGIFIALVAIDLTYPDRRKLFITPVIISFVAYAIYAYFAIFSGYPNSWVADGELIHGMNVIIIQYALLFPPSMVSVVVFFYYAIINKGTGAGTRSFWMGFAIMLFNIAFLLEVAPVIPEIAVPVRALYIVTASILYYNFMRTPKDE